MDVLSGDVIPTMMTEMNISKFSLSDGAGVEVKPVYGASIPVAKKEGAYNWLRENGLGDIIKKWVSSLRKTKVNKVAKEPGFALKIWQKYGVIGLGLLGTMSVGAPISIGIGVSFNVPTNKMVFWCSLGVVLRCAIFTAIGYYGLKLI